MHAVPAWMVQPLTGILVGTKMEMKEENLETQRHPNIKYYSELCMALACNKGGQLKPVDPAHWPRVESKIRKIVEETFHENNHTVRFEKAGIVDGFVVINCSDQFSKERLIWCVGKLRNLIAGARLTLMRAARIKSQRYYINWKSDKNNLNLDTEPVLSAKPSTYKNAQRSLKRLSKLENLNKKQKSIREKALDIISKYKNHINNEALANSLTHHSHEQERESIASSNSCGDSRHFNAVEGANDVREFASTANSSFVSEISPTCRNPNNPFRMKPREKFDIPPTSRRGARSGAKKNQLSNFDADHDSSNEVVRYYSANNPSEAPLVSRRAFDYKMEEINKNSEFMKDYGVRKNEHLFAENPQIYSHGQAFGLSAQPNFNEIEPLFSYRRKNLLPPENEHFFARNFDSPKNYDQQNEEILSDRYSEFTANTFARENEDFAPQNFDKIKGNSINELPKNSQTHLFEQRRFDSHLREEPFYSARYKLATSSQFIRQKQSAIHDYHNFLSEEFLPKEKISKRIPDAKLTAKLGFARKSNTNKSEIEAINLSDDSDVEEKPVVHVEPFKSEYYTTLDHSEMKNMIEAVKHKIEICRQKIDKYSETCKLKEKEMATTAKGSNYTTTNTRSTAKRSRWEHQHSKPINEPMHTAFEKSGRSECLTTNNLGKSETLKSSTSCTINNPKTRDIQTDADLKIAIIDRNNEDLKISKDCWLQIEKQLLEYLSEEINRTGNATIGMFGGMYEQNNIKIIRCENVESLNFIKRFITKQNNAWANMRLDVVSVKELPIRSIIQVSIPTPSIDDKSVLKILKAQNFKVCSEDWILISGSQSRCENNRDLFISISPDSLERLKMRKGEIRYGVNTLKITLPDEAKYRVYT